MASLMILRRPFIILSPLQSTSDLEIDQLTAFLRLCTLRTGAQRSTSEDASLKLAESAFIMSRVIMTMWLIPIRIHTYIRSYSFKFRWIFSMWSKALLNMFQTLFMWLSFSSEHLKNSYLKEGFTFPIVVTQNC